MYGNLLLGKSSLGPGVTGYATEKERVKVGLKDGKRNSVAGEERGRKHNREITGKT